MVPFPPLYSVVLWLCCPPVPKRGGNWTWDSGRAHKGFASSAADVGAGADCWSEALLGLWDWQYLGTAPGLATIPSLNCDFEGYWCGWVQPSLSPIKSLPHLFLWRWEIFDSPAPLSAQSHCNTPTAAFKIYFYAFLWTWLGNSSRIGTLTFLASPPEQQFSLTKKFRHLH